MRWFVAAGFVSFILAVAGCGGGSGGTSVPEAQVASGTRLVIGGEFEYGLFDVSSNGTVSTVVTGSSQLETVSVAPGPVVSVGGPVNTFYRAVKQLPETLQWERALLLNGIFPGATYGTGSAETKLVAHPDGDVLYAIMRDTNTIRVYDVGADGALTLLAITATEAAPRDLAFTPSEDFAYSSNAGADTVVAYQVEDDGTLTAFASYPTVQDPVTVLITDDGRNLYVLSPTLGVGQFRINPDGTLTSLGTFPIEVGTIATMTGNDVIVYVDPNGDAQTLTRQSDERLVRTGYRFSRGDGFMVAERWPSERLVMLIAPDGEVATVEVSDSGSMDFVSLSTSSITEPVDVAIVPVP